MPAKKRKSSKKRKTIRKSPSAGIVIGKGGSVTLHCKVTRKRKKSK